MRPVSPWNHLGWSQAAQEMLAESIANSPPLVRGARNFADACRMVDKRNARAQRAPEDKPAAKPAQSTIDATLWLRKFHPDRLEAWYAKHPGLKQHIDAL